MLCEASKLIERNRELERENYLLRSHLTLTANSLELLLSRINDERECEPRIDSEFMRLLEKSIGISKNLSPPLEIVDVESGVITPSETISTQFEVI